MGWDTVKITFSHLLVISINSSRSDINIGVNFYNSIASVRKGLRNALTTSIAITYKTRMLRFTS